MRRLEAEELDVVLVPFDRVELLGGGGGQLVSVCLSVCLSVWGAGKAARRRRRPINHSPVRPRRVGSCRRVSLGFRLRPRQVPQATRRANSRPLQRGETRFEWLVSADANHVPGGRRKDAPQEEALVAVAQLRRRQFTCIKLERPIKQAAARYNCRRSCAAKGPPPFCRLAEFRRPKRRRLWWRRRRKWRVAS